MKELLGHMNNKISTLRNQYIFKLQLKTVSRSILLLEPLKVRNEGDKTIWEQIFCFEQILLFGLQYSGAYFKI